MARAFFSKNWQLRDAAVAFLAKQAKAGELAKKGDAFRTLTRTVQVRLLHGGGQGVCVCGAFGRGAAIVPAAGRQGRLGSVKAPHHKEAGHPCLVSLSSQQ